MIKRILLTLMLVAGMAATGMAQETMYLIKGDKVVAKYGIDDVDYVSFKLPEGVKEPESLEINVSETGKNYITYTVATDVPGKRYAHAVIQESFFDYILQEYYDTTLDEASPETIYAATVICMQAFGYVGTGTQTFTIKDGETDDEGYQTFEIIANQKYRIMALELDDEFAPLDFTTDVTVTTQPAGKSTGTIAVEYAGLNENGEAMFNFTANGKFNHIYTMYGKKNILDTYIQMFGFEYTILLFGEKWDSIDELTANDSGWPVDGEDDYVMYVLGVDANGDWTDEISVSEHIVPLASETKGPQISIFSKSKDTGKVSVNFEITPSNVTEAYVRMVGENWADDRLNMGYTLADLAMGGDATDITNDINKFGEYTFTDNEVSEEWKSILIMAKNSDGTTVTRLNFYPDTDSRWAIEENINVASAAKTHKEMLKSPKLKKLNNSRNIFAVK